MKTPTTGQKVSMPGLSNGKTYKYKARVNRSTSYRYVPRRLKKKLPVVQVY